MELDGIEEQERWDNMEQELRGRRMNKEREYSLFVKIHNRK